MEFPRIVSLMVLSLFFLTFVSATVTCDPSFLNVEYTQGTTLSSSIECTNDYNYSVSITKSGTFTIEPSSSNLDPSQTKTINVDFDSDSPIGGPFNGKIEFSGQDDVLVFYKVLEPAPTSFISFPSSKRITVPQGDVYDRKVTLIMPSSYPNPINIQSIEFSEENNIIYFGDIETGILNPGEIKDIPIKINAEDAQPGAYPSISILVRLDDNGEIVTLSSTLNIFVTANLNPTTNLTFSNPPSCSISASTMNINSSYSFTCSNVQSNLVVSPLFNEYFQGENVEMTGDIYSYRFRPIKYGNTEFVSAFTYLGAPLFAPFKQEVKISSSGSSVGGTNLKFKFTPSLQNIVEGERAIVQLVDNQSGSLVESPELFIDAIPITSINNSDTSFGFTFESDRNYEVRGKATGYDDLVDTINITRKALDININPDKQIYYVGEELNITSSINNVSFLFDGYEMIFPYKLNSEGNKTIKVVKEGYDSVNKTIEVKRNVHKDAMTPILEDWKKGKKISVELSKSVDWQVTNDGVEKKAGTGDLVEFKIDEYGLWEVKSSGVTVLGVSKMIAEPEGRWKFWEWKWYSGYVLIAVLLLVGFRIFIPKKGEGSNLMMASSVAPEE